jgi:hypothetical protein
MKQGLEDPLVNFLRAGNTADKAQRVQMLEIAKRATKDLTFMQQAKSLPGKTIAEGPAKFLINTAREGTEKTNQVLTKLPQERQNARHLYDRFVDDMRQIGMEIQDNQLIRQRGSRVPEQDVRFYREIFDELRPDASGNVPLSYREMDALRDRWFRSVQADELLTEGVRNKQSGYLVRIRAMLTDEIDSVAGGAYRESQQQTAEALSVLSEYGRLLGYKGPIDKITEKDLRAGEVFMRVFGNAADRPVTVLDNLYGVARHYGYEGQENILNQLRFADILESVYGQPSRSIGGQILKSLSPSHDPAQVTASAVREAVKWSPYAGTIRFLRARGLLGKHETEVMRAFENLIRGEAGMPLETRTIAPLERSVGKIKEEAKGAIQRVRTFLGR